MGPVNCNLCGADDYVVVFRKGEAQLHQIVKCRDCGLMYANPQESVDCERLAAEEDSNLFRPEEHREYFQKQHVQLPDNMRALSVVNELIPQKGKLLEVGSYCGIFLDRIRADGWQVQGLDPSRGAVDYARRTFDLDIVEGTLPNPTIPS